MKQLRVGSSTASSAWAVEVAALKAIPAVLVRLLVAQEEAEVAGTRSGSLVTSCLRLRLLQSWWVPLVLRPAARVTRPATTKAKMVDQVVAARLVICCMPMEEVQA